MIQQQNIIDRKKYIISLLILLVPILNVGILNIIYY